MQNSRTFFVEEGESANAVDKIYADKAIYIGKFNEYIITKSHLLKDTLIITDMLSDRDGVDIVNSSIGELVFADCVKNFSEIYANFIELRNCDKDIKDTNFKFEVTEEQENSAKNLIYKFEQAIDVSDEIVKSIKIFINGYDESSESISLNLQILSEDSRYKYKITSNTIEITVLTHMDARSVKEFLDTFVYKKMNYKFDDAREIYVIINNKLAYRTEIKI